MATNRLKLCSKKTICMIISIPMLCISCYSEKDFEITIIPQPDKIELSRGVCQIDPSLFSNDNIDNLIVCQLDSSSTNINPEGYELTVTESKINLKAPTEAGLFYGKQTLRQLLTPQGIPCVKITDQPRFSYRGIHLDVSRHFFPKEVVFKVLKEMAYYKLNKFHLHLTDNGGWRIQIDKYPKLTSLGAFRTEKDWAKWFDGNDRRFLPEGTPDAYGGYYTKTDIKEIVEYASKLHIEVIPEIEFPAHSDEVFIGYPELCCTGKPYTTGEFCIGNEQIYTFMEEVLTEVMELFPSPYIHIGGDEARKAAWKTCPKCQALMKKNHMKSMDDLQCHMIDRIEQFINAKGRIMMGWDEILKNDLTTTSIVYSYRGQKGAITAANSGHKAVMTPGEVLYFDWYQATPATQPQAMYGYSPIKKTYSFDPVPTDSLSAIRNEEMIQSKAVASVEWIHPDSAKNIIGVQGCNWTEYIPTEEHLDYMMFPRLTSLAEIAWTSQNKRNWQDFKRRMNIHIGKLHQKGINAFTLTNEIELTTRLLSESNEIEVTLDTENYPVEIKYTTNGETPTKDSPTYKSSFKLNAPCIVKAAIFDRGKIQGCILEKPVDCTHEIKNYYEYIKP